MPISGVNLTPRPTAVYASDPALPRHPQDSLPSCLLGFERTRLALASSYQLSYRTPHSAGCTCGCRPGRLTRSRSTSTAGSGWRGRWDRAAPEIGAPENKTPTPGDLG